MVRARSTASCWVLAWALLLSPPGLTTFQPPFSLGTTCLSLLVRVTSWFGDGCSAH